MATIEARAVSKDHLTVEIAFDKRPKLSKSGRSRLLASTNGFITVDHPSIPGLQLSLNVICPVEGVKP